MSTTTIRMPESLKARIAGAARQAGTTSHNLILEMLEEKVGEVERRAEFHREADVRWEEFLVTGEAISWDEMREYLKKRITGKPAARPKPRKVLS